MQRKHPKTLVILAAMLACAGAIVTSVSPAHPGQIVPLTVADMDRAIPMLGPGTWTADGRPRVSALEDVLSRHVHAADRDRAWRAWQAERAPARITALERQLAAQRSRCAAERRLARSHLDDWLAVDLSMAVQGLLRCLDAPRRS